MGIGNVLLKTHDPGLGRDVSEQIGFKEHCFIRTGSDAFYSIVYSDCTITMTCSVCAKNFCVGCCGQAGIQFVYDIDADRATCTDCLGQSIFQLLQAVYTGGPVARTR